MDVCLSHIENSQSIIFFINSIDSLKPPFCTFIGVYIIRHLKEALKENKKEDNIDMTLQILANDFCANVKDSIKERLLFLN